MNQLPLLIESTVKASLVMLAAFAAIACFRRRGSAAMRHWILSAAIVAATAAPLLGAVVPSWHVPFGAIPRPRLIAPTAASSDASVIRRSGATPEPTPQTSTGISLSGVAAFIATTWAAGAGISALILIVGLGRLAWVASSARRVVSDGIRKPWICMSPQC
jgi:beta-lactamase regulating signal transducer with metallopeptidase domain